MTRPGLTTATHFSGLPLPEPMRVSAGFCVTGLSGETLIHTLPPRLMWRVMAMRAASIWRAVIHPGSRAWMPNSPKLTSVPPLALPLIRPRWCLRCATLRGINMSLVYRTEVGRLGVVVHPALDLFLFGQQALELGIGLLDEGLVLGHGCLFGGALGGAPAGAGRRGHDALAALGGGAGGLADGHGRLARDLLLALRLVGEDIALVEPHLDADATGGGAGLAGAVVGVGPERVTGDATLAVALGAGHLGAAEAARAHHLDALGTGLLGVLHGALHGAAEGDAGGELVGDALGDQRSVELGLLDLLDVELHLGVAGDLGQAATQAVGLAAPAPDDDARARGVHVDAQAVAGALDLDPADRGMRQLGHQVVADLPVLDDVVAVFLAVSEPTRLPVGRDAEPEPVGVDLLSHYFVSSSPASVSSASSATACSVATTFSSVVSSALSWTAASASATMASVGSPVVGSSSTTSSVGSSLVVASATCSPRLRATRARRDSWPRPRRPVVAPAPAAARLASTRAAISAGIGLTMIVMWLMRLRMRVARPRARGRQRLSVGPSSA